MRFRATALAIALALVYHIAVLPSAWAQPAGVVAADGVWKSPDGRTLFVYTGQQAVPPLCDQEACAGGGGWAPFPAWGKPPDGPEWTIVSIGALGRQWAFRGSPLYTRNGAWDAKVATAQASSWRAASALQDGVAPARVLDLRDPSITVQPTRLQGPPPEYPTGSLRAKEGGSTTASFCIDADGVPQYVATAKSAGFPRLDAATRIWVWRSVRFTPAMAGDQRVAVCNFTIDSDWKLPPTR
jgi:predicted lipoprotein with Yx(FWY)xxD motif